MHDSRHHAICDAPDHLRLAMYHFSLGCMLAKDSRAKHTLHEFRTRFLINFDLVHVPARSPFIGIFVDRVCLEVRQDRLEVSIRLDAQLPHSIIVVGPERLQTI